MQRELTYQYRLYPNQAQQANILRVAEASRCFYNLILRENDQAFRETGVWKQKFDVVKDLEQFAAQHRVQPSVLKYSAADYNRAFRKYLKVYQPNQYKDSAKVRAVFWPKFPLTDADLKGAPNEKAGGTARRTFSLDPSLLLFQENAVCIPDVGWVKAVFHRLPPIEAKLTRCTVMAKSSGKFFLHIQIAMEVEDKRPDHVPDEALGVVFSPGVLAVRSDGVPVKVRHSDPELEKQIEKACRTLKRRTPGSKGHEEQRRKLAKLYEKQVNRRRDALHKASSEIAGSGKYVGIQLPAVKKQAAKHKKEKLDQVIRDEAWYTFFDMVQYKCQSDKNGMPCYVIPRAYPVNEICGFCGANLKQEPITRDWFCPKCGKLCGKSENAARNVQRFIENEIDQWKALSQD